MYTFLALLVLFRWMAVRTYTIEKATPLSGAPERGCQERVRLFAVITQFLDIQSRI